MAGVGRLGHNGTDDQANEALVIWADIHVCKWTKVVRGSMVSQSPRATGGQMVNEMIWEVVQCIHGLEEGGGRDRSGVSMTRCVMNGLTTLPLNSVVFPRKP